MARCAFMGPLFEGVPFIPGQPLLATRMGKPHHCHISGTSILENGLSPGGDKTILLKSTLTSKHLLGRSLADGQDPFEDRSVRSGKQNFLGTDTGEGGMPLVRPEGSLRFKDVSFVLQGPSGRARALLPPNPRRSSCKGA